jgi:DNA mismatch endonuclease (patch repair protein)
MPDTLNQNERSARMALIRCKDTQPEMVVRRLVHGMGYRYKLHDRSLLGKPDLVFPVRKKIILVHGCFWHRHSIKTCRLARLPKSRLEFWKPKLEANRLRDTKIRRELTKEGWQVLTIWECQLANTNLIVKRIESFLN